tara:strand:- start:45 stop:461 length:417 start_codon:yes stop_codon:yes gene_type:complete
LLVVGQDPTVSESDHSVRVRGDLGIVGDHDDRQSGLVLLLQQFENFGPGVLVEIAGGFVCQQKIRIAPKSMPYRDTLAFSARELAWAMAISLIQAEVPERRSCRVGGFSGSHPCSEHDGLCHLSQHDHHARTNDGACT